jgi:hypothetical protein
MKMSVKPDANDLNYDAYLANDRTLRDPEVIKVETEGLLRLRIINGGNGTNFFERDEMLTAKRADAVCIPRLRPTLIV